jgi:hypothetical protein
VNAPLSEQQSLDAPARLPNGVAEAEPIGLTEEELAVVQAAVKGRRAHGDSSDESVATEPASGRVRQAWDQIQMAFPRLMGQPAYWRPRTMITPTERPFDPDDLPLEAERVEEERRLAAELARASAVAANKDRGEGSGRGWRSVTRLLRLGD